MYTIFLKINVDIFTRVYYYKIVMATLEKIFFESKQLVCAK